ncbi:MAG: glycoside hydrolase family 3 C-terminal domain-containing protein, partial [Cellulosilyticaceae bacterium]
MKNKKIKHVISIILVIILVVVNGLCYNFKNIINLYLAKANTADEETMKQVTEQAKNVVQEIEGEGIVLLENKNNTLPLNKSTNVNIFGWGSVAPVYGGNGSGASNAAANITLQQGLIQAGINVNDELTKFYTDLGFARQESGPLNDFAPDYRVYEADPSLYTDALLNNAKAFSDVAVVMLTRVGGEGSDLANEMGDWEADKGRHFLELTSKEEAMLDIVKENFETVIVLVNSSNAMELGFLEEEGIDAALWVGGPGQTGMAAIGQVLVGDVNPSGALVDTYAYDATSSPAYQNFGYFSYPNARFGPNGNDWERAYVEYQEGIYVGYRYYETRFVDNQTGECDEEAYKQVVQYPFGYGLSYTSFDQQITGFKAKDDVIEVEVKVTNTGDVAGKEIVQVYHTAPYTVGGIEKSHVVLSAFGKTEILEPGKSETVTLTFPIEEMASYDYKDAKAYVLEAGNYEIKLMDNAHQVMDSKTYTLAETIIYDEANKRESDKIVATNLFDDAHGD